MTVLPLDERVHSVAPGGALYPTSVTTEVLGVSHLGEDRRGRGDVVRAGGVPGLAPQPILSGVGPALVIPPVTGDTVGGHQVPPQVSQARPGAGVVPAGGRRQPRQELALRESEVAPGPHHHSLLSLPDEVCPLGVAEHLLHSHTVLVTQRQTSGLALLDAAVREGVVAEHSLGRGPAGLGQAVDQLLLDGGRQLLVPPAARVVLADVEPNQAAAHDVVPADGPVVGSTVALHSPALLPSLLLPGYVDHEAPLVLGSLRGELVPGLAGEVTALLRGHPQHRPRVEGERGPLHSSDYLELTRSLVNLFFLSLK